jgi:REP element-mobilizing transposase RayT
MLLKRKNLRLKNYDYSQPGAYFVTICCRYRRPMLGSIDEYGEIHLNDIGRMIACWYGKIENKFPNMKCDEFICMPNHVHMIIQILPEPGKHGSARRPTPTDALLNDNNVDRGSSPRPTPTNALLNNNNVGAGLCARPFALRARPLNTPTRLHANLFQVVQWFKSITTNGYLQYLRQTDAPNGVGVLWQRGYYEHVIRNDDELSQTRQYIINNPKIKHDDEQR